VVIESWMKGAPVLSEAREISEPAITPWFFTGVLGSTERPLRRSLTTMVGSWRHLQSQQMQ